MIDIIGGIIILLMMLLIMLKLIMMFKMIVLFYIIGGILLERFKMLCRLGDVYRNRDFVGGLGVGNFIDKGKVDIIEECMKICCGIWDCFVVYVVENNCFVIICMEKE